MSTGKTTYLGLHRWEPDDNFLRAEFNENSDKLDSELQTMQKEMTGEFAAVRSELTAGLGGKAAATHTHGAGDIASGTLPVARGGTGNTAVDTAPTSGSTKMVTSGGVYTALSGKAASTHTHTLAALGAQAAVTGAATTITGSNLTANRALISNGNGKVAVSGATSTELSYLSGVTSAIQTQLNAKQAASSALKMEVLAHMGTNTYGESNPTVLSFSFVPKVVFLMGRHGKTPYDGIGYNYAGDYCIMDCTSLTTSWQVSTATRGFFGAYSSVYYKKSSDGKTVYTYCSNGAINQFNDTGNTYYFLAIG